MFWVKNVIANKSLESLPIYLNMCINCLRKVRLRNWKKFTTLTFSQKFSKAQNKLKVKLTSIRWMLTLRSAFFAFSMLVSIAFIWASIHSTRLDFTGSNSGANFSFNHAYRKNVLKEYDYQKITMQRHGQFRNNRWDGRIFIWWPLTRQEIEWWAEAITNKKSSIDPRTNTRTGQKIWKIEGQMVWTRI